jgi:hypothetical protein
MKESVLKIKYYLDTDSIVTANVIDLITELHDNI